MPMASRRLEGCEKGKASGKKNELLGRSRGILGNGGGKRIYDDGNKAVWRRAVKLAWRLGVWPRGVSQIKACRREAVWHLQRAKPANLVCPPPTFTIKITPYPHLYLLRAPQPRLGFEKGQQPPQGTNSVLAKAQFPCSIVLLYQYRRPIFLGIVLRRDVGSYNYVALLGTSTNIQQYSM